MSPLRKSRYVRAVLALLSILIAFLLVVVAEIFAHRADMMADMETNVDREFLLVETLLRESLLRHDYAAVEQFLLHMSEEHDQVVEIRATAPNGFVLLHYERDKPSAHTIKVDKTVSYGGEDLLALEIVNDFTPAAESLRKLSITLVGGAVLLTSAMGLGAWLAFRRMALKPLEQEISARESAERELMAARDNLEGMVRERTAELAESEEKYRALMRDASDAVFLTDTEGLFIDANRKAEELTGYSRDEILGMHLTGLLNKEDAERARAVFARGKASPMAVVRREIKILRKDGGEVYVELTASFVEYAGKAVGHAVLRDITERRKAEDELRSLYATMNAIINHMPEGVALLDDKGRVKLANPVGGEYLACLADAEVGDVVAQLGGRSLKDLLVSPPHILWYDLEVNGRVFEVAGRTIGIGRAAERGTVFVMREVTEAKRVEESTRLQERLAAVGQLAAGISHDFNNILTVISGYAEMLLGDERLDERTRQEVEIISQSADRATELIQQVLDFSRVTVGEMVPLDLVPAVDEFLQFMGRTLPENITVSFDHADPGYVVRADATKLQQVLANLAVNARDAMPDGGTLGIRLSPFSLNPGDRPPADGMPSGEWVALTVSDTGQGIPRDALPHIFEPFFTTKEVGKGSGLGLSQVYGLVKQHGGYIDVKTADSGSSFVIYLPLSHGEGVEVRERKGEAYPRGKGQTVLIVEDESTVLQLVRRVLNAMGYRALTASNGREGLDVFRSHCGEIGLVITDVIMPEMDGYALSRAIRKEKPDMKVIAVSGYALDLSDRELADTGIVEFIKKPFTISTLAETVSRVLEG